MIKSEIIEALKKIGIDVSDVIIEPSKKKVFKNSLGHETVGLFPKELKKDFWFWDGYNMKLWLLPKAESNKNFPKEEFGGAEKYQVPLSAFVEYEYVWRDSNKKNPALKAIETEAGVAQEQVKKIISNRRMQPMQGPIPTSSTFYPSLEIKKVPEILSDSTAKISTTLELKDISLEKLQAILDIIKN